MNGSSVAHGRVWVPAGVDALDREQRHYLETVLRLRLGDVFTVTDGAGRESTARLGANGRFSVDSWVEPAREPSMRVTLFAAVTKGDRFEGLLEKAVELGVAAVVPVLTARCVAGSPAAGKLDRWRKIAVGAMLQCGGCRLPEIRGPVRLADLPSPVGEVVPLLLHEEPAEVPAPLPEGRPAEAWVVSGPEGGFTGEEVSGLTAAGWRHIWLGPRRLRADTAPLVLLAWLLGWEGKG
ncbi:MAG: 16S rRNA (uracil(1498)-N(3))-methyltransferase [Candidatus Riflebacteria bacterium]|nr:16S rRNA (uracil(1498)-N(3))-methyltransferase [Candidatus Riflebacteria bacterium]